MVFEADAEDQIGLEIEARYNIVTYTVRSADPKVYNVDVYNMGVFRYESGIGLPAMLTGRPMEATPTASTSSKRLPRVTSSRGLGWAIGAPLSRPRR